MSTQGVKRKRCAYDAAFKLKVISAARETNNSAAAREFGVNEKHVRDWRNLKKPGLSTVAQWVLDSWQSIDADMFARSFKKTSISKALDRTEDNVLWTADSNSRVNDDANSEDDWDTDEQMCLADYTALFGNNDTSDGSDFEGF